MERNLLFQPRLLHGPSESSRKKGTSEKFSPTHTHVLNSPSDFHNAEKSGHYTERIDRKEGLMNDLLLELSNNLKSKGIGDERIQRMLRDKRKKRKEIIVDEQFDELFEFKNSRLISKPSESYLHNRTKSIGINTATTAKKNKSFVQEKQKSTQDKSPEFKLTPTYKLNSSDIMKKSDRTSKASKHIHYSKKKESQVNQDIDNQIKEEELIRREKQLEDQKEAWERTLTSRLLELKKSEAEVLRQKQEITIEFRKLHVFKDELEHRSREIIIKEESIKKEAIMNRAKINSQQDERYRMSREDLNSCAMRLDSFEVWLLFREKELEEVNGMLLNERTDLEKTEEFFEELDKDLQNKSFKLKNENEAIEAAWIELEVERKRLHKWSMQLQNLGNQLQLKEHQLDCSMGALTERRKALKQYQKALDIRERTAYEADYSPINKLSRALNNKYQESNSRSSDLDIRDSQIEDFESDLTGELISVLTPRSSVSSVAY